MRLAKICDKGFSAKPHHRSMPSLGRCHRWRASSLLWSLVVSGCLLWRGSLPAFHVAVRQSDDIRSRPQRLASSNGRMRKNGNIVLRQRSRKPGVGIGCGTVSGNEVKAVQDDDDDYRKRILILNLCKNLIGAGILSLPSGVAAVSASRQAVLAATLVTVLVGMSSGYTFALVGRGLSLTGRRSLRGAWESAIGKDSAWVVSGAITIKTGFACLVYAMVLGDAGSSLAAAFGLPAAIAARTPMICIISSCLLVPLSFLENLEVLKYTSFLGLSGILYTIGAMALRFYEGAYSAGGKYHYATARALRPVFNSTPGSWFSLQALIYMSCLAFAFTAHYNAPKFYAEANQKLSTYNAVVAGGFAATVLLCIAMMALGFLTFGGSSAGLILNNYAASDKLFTIARLGISINILCTFPFIFVSFRDSLTESLPPEWQDRATKLKTPTTLSLLVSMTVLAVLLRDLGPVAAVSGAVLGSAISFIFPSLIFLGATKRKPRSALLRLERTVARSLALLGCGLAVLGTLTSLGVV